MLTADQAAKMTFRGEAGEAEISYLPVFKDRVEDVETALFSIRSREDQAPVAEDSAAETYKNLPGTATLRVKDPEGQKMTYTVTREPRRGTVTIEEGGSFTYTPKKNKVGVDSFTYTATDPAGNVSREATVTVTILKPSEAASYTDTANMSCSFAAEWMKNTGIFVGEKIGDAWCFQPEKPVNRGEFLTMLMKTLEIPPEEDLEVSVGDVPRWLQPYVAAAVRSGIPAGDLDRESFSENITRTEAAVMVQNALDLSPSSAKENPEDIPAWAASSMADSKVNPESEEIPLTRESSAELLYAVHLFKAAQ